MNQPDTHSIQLLQNVYATADKMAISTSLNGQADVRIINFIWFPNEPNKLYFSSVKGVKAVPSTKTMAGLLPRYLELVPNYQKTWDAIGSSLVVYEINLQDVYVDAGIGQEKIDIHFH